MTRTATVLKKLTAPALWALALLAATLLLLGQPPDAQGQAADTTPPNTHIGTGSPSSATNKTDAAFSFYSSEPNGASFECSLDGAAYAACQSPKSYSKLAEGKHTFKVRALDASGNADTSPASKSWVVDLTKPVVTISQKPADTNDTTAALGFSANEPTYGFYCSLDGKKPVNCTNPKEYKNLTLDRHYFKVYAKDKAGNFSEVPARHSWTIEAEYDGNALESRLLTAASGLWLTSSESDTPFEGVLFEDEGRLPSLGRFAELSNCEYPEGGALSINFDTAYKKLTTASDPGDPRAVENAEGFAEVSQILKRNTTEQAVYRCESGGPENFVYHVGLTPTGNVVGLTTVSIET